MSDLLLSIATRTTPAQLAPFVRSWQRTGSDAEAVVFVSASEVDAFEAAYPEAGITWQGIPRTWHWPPEGKVGWPWKVAWRTLSRIERQRRRLTRSMKRGAIPARPEEVLAMGVVPRLGGRRNWFLPPVKIRHGLYLQAILDRPGAKRIWTVDSRDILFQGDPFASDLPDGLATFRVPGVPPAVGEPRPLTAEEWTGRGVVAHYGLDGLRTIEGKPIVCAGTTYGPRDAMIEYLGSMWREVARHRFAFTDIRYWDQAIHNVVVRTLETFEFPSDQGPVATLHPLPTDLVRWDGHEVRSRDGGTPAIVHQADRHPEIEAALVARLCPTDGPVSTV